MPPRKSARNAPPSAATALWSAPNAGGEWQDLFERVLAAVHQFQDEKPLTLAAMRLVSRRWRKLVDDSITVLPRRSLREPALSQLLCRFRNLRALNAEEAFPSLQRCEDATLPALLGLRRLEMLGLTFSCGPEAIAQLAPLRPTLTALSYYGDMTSTRSRRSAQGAGMNDAAAAAVGGSLTALQQLSISRCAELGPGVAAFSGLTRLHTLRLYEIGKLDDATLVTAVSSLTRLTKLTVAMCGIGDAAMAGVAALTDLQFLDLSENAELGDAGVRQLSGLSVLQSLNLSGASQVRLWTLPPLGALHHLEVASTETDDSGLLTLQHLPALARLSLADCQQLSGAGLYALRCISGLISLNLNSCLELGEDDPLAAVRFLTGLTSLKLSFIEDLTDADVGNLAPLTRLEVLLLHGLYELGPEGRATLLRLRRLSVLMLPDLTLTSEEADVFKAAMPKLIEFRWLQAGTIQSLMEEMEAANDDDDE